jgi:hypothetical protein
LGGPAYGGPPPPPLFLLSESSRHSTHGANHHQQPPSAWQVSFGLENSSLPPSGEVAKCFVLSGIIDRAPNNSVECHQVNYDADRCSPQPPYQISQRIDSRVNLAITLDFNSFSFPGRNCHGQNVFEWLLVPLCFSLNRVRC